MAKKREEGERPPDIELGATVRMDELRFEQVPDSEVTFRGDPDYESESESERENLPNEVEPGVTYRGSRVRWRISNRLSEDP